MTPDRSAETELLEFLYACPVGLVEIDRSGRIAMINPHAMKHLMPIAAEARRDVSNLFTTLENTAPELRNLFDAFAAPSGIVCENHRIVADLRPQRNGSVKVLSCTVVKLGPDRAIATFADVTAQVDQERRLKLAETWFSSLLNGVNDYALLAITPNGIVESANRSFQRQTGHDCEQVEGQELSALLDDPASPAQPGMQDQLRTASTEGWALDENWQCRRDGERYWCQRLVVARVGTDGATVEGFTVVLRDVVRQTSASGDLRRILTEDHLTGAANRAHFLQRAEVAHRAWQQTGQPLSLILIDIDHFKHINDHHGHPAGDQVLRKMAQACIGSLRPGNLFARLGGEEFAVLLPNGGLSEALSVAERLRAILAALCIAVSDRELRITASFGCATATGMDTIESLVKAADNRLYEAKRSGRDRVCGPQPLAAAV